MTKVTRQPSSAEGRTGAAKTNASRPAGSGRTSASGASRTSTVAPARTGTAKSSPATTTTAKTATGKNTSAKTTSAKPEAAGSTPARTTTGGTTPAKRTSAATSTNGRTTTARTTSVKAGGAKVDPVQDDTVESRTGKATVTRVKPATKAAPTTPKSTTPKSTTLKSTTLTPAKKGAAEAEPSDTPSRPRGYTPSKKELGLATPRRRGGGRIAEPAPANRREAMRRQRQKDREARMEQRAGMMAGKEEFLMKRDRGPERALVRDIVDSRRSLATMFIPVALVVILGTSVAAPQVRQFANILWYCVALLIIVDSFFLTRKVKRLLKEQFPKNPLPPRSYYFYAIMRTLSFRRLRMPAPRVRPESWPWRRSAS